MSQDIYISVQPVTGEDVYVNVSPNLAGVLFVNGRDGIVVLNKSDVGLSNVENVSITGASGYLQNQINNLDLNYASDLQLSQTGSNLQQQINTLYGSGFITGVDLSHLYPRSNPSGFITGVNLSNYATVSSLELTGSNLQNQINNIDISSQLTGVSGYFQNQFDNLDANYANQNEFNTLSGNLNLTGQSLNSIITNYSGFVSNNFARITGLNQSYRNLYISNIIGNNSTARIGSINLPYQTAQAAWNAISSSLPSSSYILNFYGDTSATANYTINVGDIDWPSNVGVRGIGPGPIALTITHNNIGPTTAKGKNFNITDWGYQSVSLSITSLGGSWAGGLAMNGGDGGDITLKNCLFNTITTQGGSASNSNRWGVFGSVNLDNCRGGILNLTQGSNGIGPVTSTASLTFINSDFNINSTSTNIPGTHTIRNCSIQFPLFQFQNANRYYKNTTDTRINTYYIDTAILSGNRVVKNFQISDSAILSGNLTGVVLHDNITGRLKSGYRQGAFVADFASGIYLYPFVESPNLVYNTGNQTINGTKTFVVRPTVNGTGVLLSGEAYPSNNPSGFLTGVDLSSYATISNLATTGSTLQSSVNTLTNNLATTGSTLSTNIATTGSTLTTQINNLSGTLTGNYATISNLVLTGLNLDSKINNLSGVSVLTYGNQIINGTKYFNDSVYIHDLYVTGTEFIATVQNNFIESPYILLNLTGGAIDGGIFFVTGAGLTGVNDYGPILGFDHTSKFKFGVARRSDDLSTLNDIQAALTIASNLTLFSDTTLTAGRNVQQRVQTYSSTNINLTLPTSGIESADTLTIIAVAESTGDIVIRRQNHDGSGYGPQFTTLATATLGGDGERFTFRFGSGWILLPVDTHTHPAAAISDSTTAGRALLTGADAAAQRTSLGLGTAATSASTDFYSSNNPSGFITGIENIVYITGDQLVSGLKTFSDNINTNQIKGITGQFIGNSLSLIGGDGTSFGGPVIIRGGTGVNAGGNIQLNSNVSANRGTNKSLGIQAFRSGQVGEASIDIDDTIFNVKNGLTFQISGETVDPLNYYTKDNPSGFITGIDTSNFYTNNNPSGFITNANVVYATGDQTIGGLKTFSSGIFVTGGTINLAGKDVVGITNAFGESVIIRGGSGVGDGSAFSFANGGNITLIGGTALSGGFPPVTPGNVTIIGGSGGNLPTFAPLPETIGSINLYGGARTLDNRGGPIIAHGNIYINPDPTKSREFIIYKSGNGALGAADNLVVRQNSVNVNNLLTVSGNPVLTGVNLSNYATTGQLNQASGNLQSQIDILNVNSIAYAIALG
jgi:hypothetical protein